MKKIESHVTFFVKPTAEMSNYKCSDIFMCVTNDKYVYFIAPRMGVLKKIPYNFRIFYCAKKENSLTIEITSGNKFINCQNNPASYVFQMLQLLV